ncbi:MAG: hypothetical protein QXZ70_09090 [Candidatus Bathyarchaeia archaeon]
MKKQLSVYSAIFFLSAVVGIIGGFFILFTMPWAWTIGLLLLGVGLVYVLLALAKIEIVREEHEKPLMDVVSAAEEEKRAKLLSKEKESE